MPFGKKWLEQWWLEPGAVYLNHGTVGATPKAVLASQEALRQQMERQPAQFVLRELMHLGPGEPPTPPRLRQAAERVAAWLGAHGPDLVFVDNATTGVNAVLRSLKLEAGDEVVIPSLAYGAVTKVAQYVTRQVGAQLKVLDWPFPPQPERYLQSLEQALGPRTRLVILDHITSETALLMPVKQHIELARSQGALVLVDGAHAPGAVPVNLAHLNADFYTANLHKWAMAPRGCGFLWAQPQHQPWLHPPVISWGLDSGFVREFDWVGTRDPTPFLAAPAALEFMEGLGVLAMQQYNHQLAWQAATFLSDRWGLQWNTPAEMVGTMVTVPLPSALGDGFEQAHRLRQDLWQHERIEVPIMAIGDKLWARISAQVYNDLSDIERLAWAIDQRL